MRYAAIGMFIFLAACRSTPPDRSAPAASAVTAETCAEQSRSALAGKNAEKLAELAHPTRGVRFTSFGFVNTSKDVVLSVHDLRGAFSDASKRTWGTLGESDDPIRMTFAEYHARFIYDDGLAARTPAKSGTTDPMEQRSWNVAELDRSIRRAYPSGKVFEYRRPPSQPDALDWRIVRIVCEELAGSHYLVGVVHNEATP